MIPDPEQPGRGPNPHHMGEVYLWERDNDFPVIGRFAGVVLGTSKRADTLVVGVTDKDYITIRYEHLIAAVRQ